MSAPTKTTSPERLSRAARLDEEQRRSLHTVDEIRGAVWDHNRLCRACVGEDSATWGLTTHDGRAAYGYTSTPMLVWLSEALTFDLWCHECGTDLAA